MSRSIPLVVPHFVYHIAPAAVEYADLVAAPIARDHPGAHCEGRTSRAREAAVAPVGGRETTPWFSVKKSQTRKRHTLNPLTNEMDHP
ncbi:hypothetical protein [Dyadobacter sp.]|uniref:hypothetical protein n=1 Tax=Dyadobacter sp. TaxID=1914288 RepID=UPI003F725509